MTASTTAAVISNPVVAGELGYLEEWLEAHGFGIRRLIRDDVLAVDAADDADLLIVLGSAWSMTERSPAIDAELALVRRWHDADRPLFGICFGGQLLSTALGGTVTRQAQPFAGWVVPETDRDVVDAPWLVWHNDRFTVPPGASAIATAPHAALGFRSRRSWGIQFHPEIDLATLERLVVDLDASPEVAELLLSGLAPREDEQRAQSLALFDHVAADIGL